MANQRILTIREYIRRKAFGIGNGTVETTISPETRASETTFINDPNEIQKLLIEENNVWYAGSSDALLNFYTRADFIDYNYDPIYNRNKRNYFWANSASEGDYKRTHSGQPRNIVDTLCAIIAVPHVNAIDPEREKRLHVILKENNYDELMLKESRPYTLVEGWGAYKINWNEDISDTPILLYYRANSVDFIYRNRRLVAIVYQDYYTDEDDRKYVLFEIRRLERREIVNPQTGIRAKKLCLIIEKELFRYLNEQTDNIMKVPLETLPELQDTKPCLIIEDCPYFLGAPSIYYRDSTNNSPGRSIFTGKLDLFDDLDMALSQGSNAMKRSTPLEYIDANFLERDEHTGQPKQPKSFDRKYIMYHSVLGGDGQMAKEPVTVTQPNINFEQYSAQAREILIQIVNGVISPATLGIDIAKKDNAEAAREKEKVTIFTRNDLIATEKAVQEQLMIQLLIADQLMHSEKDYNEITRYEDESDWGISIKYDEFADASFEAKLETVLTGWQGGLLSDDMAIEYLHRGSPESVKARELEFIKKQREEEKELAGREGEGGDAVPGDDELAALGAALGGNQDNPYNKAHEKADIDDVEEDNGVMPIADYKDYEKNREERLK